MSLVYLTTTKVYVLINYTAFIESLAVAFSVLALIWLRIKQPDLPRPIQVNIIIPIVFFVVCTFLVLLPFYVSPYETGIGAAITFSGIPVYLVTIKWKNKPKWYSSGIGMFAWIYSTLFKVHWLNVSFLGSLTKFIQKLFFSTKEDKLLDW